jgi:hypothetical protein
MISQIANATYASSVNSDVGRLRLAPAAVEDLDVANQYVTAHHGFSHAAIGKCSRRL